MQEQHGGIGSKNTQIGNITVNNGLGYNDVKDIATDVFRQNFPILMQQAAQTANERAQKLLEDFLRAAQKEGKMDPSSFKQPEKQLALYEAQKAFALSGDEELGAILVRTVLDLSKEPERSLKSLILQEAIKTLAIITPQQRMVLAATAIIREATFQHACDFGILSHLYRCYLGERWIDLDPKESDFRHLQFSGCGSINPIVHHPFIDIIKNTYPSIVSSGYPKSVLESAFMCVGVPRGLGVIPCLGNSGNFRLYIGKTPDLEFLAQQLQWTETQLSIAKEKATNTPVPDHDIAQAIEKTGGILAHLAKKWDETSMKSFTPTSVGVAIGYAHFAAQQQSPPDLLQGWISR